MEHPVEPPVLSLGRVTLRPFRADDAAARAALGQDAEISRMFGGSPDWVGTRPMTADEGQGWLDHVTRDGGPHHWALEVGERFVGTARLHGLVEEDRRARYAVGLLDPLLLGQGLGRETTRCVLAYAFGRLALHRVDLRVLAYNQRAIASYRGCGFVEEGREREAAWVDGAWHDDVIMGVLAHEFADTSGEPAS